jgi:hypothetical protein
LKNDSATLNLGALFEFFAQALDWLLANLKKFKAI